MSDTIWFIIIGILFAALGVLGDRRVPYGNRVCIFQNNGLSGPMEKEEL